MIYVRIELWPGGDKDKRETIGEALIANDGLGTEQVGNYNFQLFGKRQRPLQKGKVKNFSRKTKHVWDLVKLVLEESR